MAEGFGNVSGILIAAFSGGDEAEEEEEEEEEPDNKGVALMMLGQTDSPLPSVVNEGSSEDAATVTFETLVMGGWGGTALPPLAGLVGEFGRAMVVGFDMVVGFVRGVGFAGGVGFETGVGFAGVVGLIRMVGLAASVRLGTIVEVRLARVEEAVGWVAVSSGKRKLTVNGVTNHGPS